MVPPSSRAGHRRLRTFSSTGNVGSSYVTTAAVPNGTVAMSYLPEGGKILVDMARFTYSVRARWFDPSSGTYRSAVGTESSTLGRDVVRDDRERTPTETATGCSC
jgi:hypothetical protein